MRSTIVAELYLADDVTCATYYPVKLLSSAVELPSIPESVSRVIASPGSLADMAGGLSGGTGQKLTQATIIVAGVAALLASLLSVV